MQVAKLSERVAAFSVLFVLILTVAVAFGKKESKDAVRSGAGVLTEITEAGDVAGGGDTGVVIETTETAEPAAANAGSAKVILTVKNMSCSGCISTIKGSLSGIAGVKEILVDVGSGTTEVYYDHKELEDVSRIAAAISAGGYPAEVRRVFSPEEIKRKRELATTKSQYYIASVGGWDIARADFETELEIAQKRYVKIYGDTVFTSGRGEVLLDNLRVQIVSRLLDEGIVMQEVNKYGFKVDPETVEKEMQKFLLNHGNSLEEFKKSLNEMGYDYDYFKKKFEIRVLMNQYVDRKILAGTSNQFQRESMYKSWFNNSRLLAEVVYYDKDLERLAQRETASGGCCAAN